MRKVRIKPGRALLSVLLLAFMVYCLVTFVSQAKQIRENKETLVSINAELKEEKKRAITLDEQTAKIGSDEFIEQQAKEKLGYVKSNEKIFYDKSQ